MVVGGVGGIKLPRMRLLIIHSPARGRGGEVSSNDMPQQALTYGEDSLEQWSETKEGSSAGQCQFKHME